MSASILIRPASLADAPAMAKVASETFQKTAFDHFLAPHRSLYPADFKTAFQQRITARILDPRNVTYVACEAGSLDVPIGHAQFIRLGDDAGSRAQIASKSTPLLVILAWVFKIWFKIRNFIIPDRSADRNAVNMFNVYAENEEKEHWAAEKFPERKNRWHTQNVVVSEKWQRKGVGSLLMNEVLKRAQAEGVVVGLESSGQGEKLYRKLGFELLGRYMVDIEGKGIGGVMMYTPESAKKKE